MPRGISLMGKRLNSKLQRLLIIAGSMLIVASLVGSNGTSTTGSDQSVDYRPLRGADRVVSTPVEQGLDPGLIDDLYANAAELETPAIACS
jgi:hypothetical protein